MGRQVPYTGMPVTILHLGAREAAVVEAVEDGGRTLVADGRRYTLRELNARYVLEGEPSYGTRVAFEA